MRAHPIRFQSALSQIPSSKIHRVKLCGRSILISSRFKSTFHASLSADRSCSAACSSFKSDGAYQNSPQNARLRWYSSILSICASNRILNLGKEVHGRVIRSGIEPDSHLWDSLVNFYAKCGSFTSAYQLFDEMCESDVVSWNCLISSLMAEGYGSDALILYCRMRKDGISPNEYALASALRASSSCLDLNFGTLLHAEVIKFGLFADAFIGSALVELHAKCGKLQLAERLFVYLPENNVVAWNVLLNAYASAADGDKVLNLFSRIREPEVRYSKYSLSTLLKVCADMGNLRVGQILHCTAIKIEYELDEFLVCCLLDMYSKCGLAIDTLKIFRRICNPGIIAWSVTINCLERQGQSEEVAGFFNSMRQKGVRPNQHILAKMVGAASNLRDTGYSECIHGCVVKYGCESDNFISNSLITMYMNIGNPQKSWQVFKDMPCHDLASWNALLTMLNENESYNDGPKVFRQMLEEGFKPDDYTFSSILCSCSSLSNLGLGQQIHAHAIKKGFAGNKHVGTSLIDMYAGDSYKGFAEVVFNEMGERDILAWTAIITVYAKSDHGEKAIGCFNQMRREGLKPNEFTICSSLSSCSDQNLLQSGRQLHALTKKCGLVGDTYVCTSLVGMYMKCRSVEEAEDVFLDISSKNLVLWNTIICGYSQHGLGQKAIEAFQQMQCEGGVPDEITFVGVLSACSHMGLIKEGENLFNSLSTIYKITPTVEHFAIMAKLLCKEGDFTKFERFVHETKLTENPLIWESILWVCKENGNVELAEKAAQRLFELEPEVDYNYIRLSEIFASAERWDDVVKVRSLMSDQGIKKQPGCSWVETRAQPRIFFAQDGSFPSVRETIEQLEKQAR